MNFLIDGIIIAIVLGCCIWGYKSGFVVMVINFFKNILALIAAALFATRLGALLYDLVFKAMFEDMTVNKIAGWLGVDPEATLDIGPLLIAQHTEFSKFLEKLGFDIEHIMEKYNEFGGNAGDMMIEYIAKPLGTVVSNAIAFVLIFIAAVIIIKIVGSIINKIAKLPVLNITNKILGFVLGLALGVIFAFVFVAIVDVIIPYISINGEHLTAASLEEGTIIYKFLVDRTPVGLVEEILQKTGVK